MFDVPSNTVASPRRLAVAHPAGIAAHFARERHAWSHLLRYDPTQRFTALVERTEHYEVWLLSWLPGQHTELHDHGGASGAFHVVQGELEEWVVKRDTESRYQVSAGQTRVFGSDYLHMVRNAGTDPAISLHVYAPVRASMTTYEFDATTGIRPVRTLSPEFENITVEDLAGLD